MLKDVRAEQVARLQTDINTVTAQVKQAAAGQAEAQQQVQADQASLTQLQAAASALQQQFATAGMKLEQHAIEQDLYQNKIDRRTAEIALATHQDKLAAATQQAQSLAGKAAALNAALAQAKADLSAAEQQDAAAGDDRSVLTTLVADTARQAAGQDVIDQMAKARAALAALVGGEGMMDVLRARYDHGRAIADDKKLAVARAQRAAFAVTQAAAAHAAGLDDAAVTQLAAAGTVGLDTVAAEYDDARAEVSRWATQGPASLDSARQALQKSIGTPAFQAMVSDDITKKAKDATDSGAAKADHDYHHAAAVSIARNGELDAVTGPNYAVNPGYDPTKDDAVKPQREAAGKAAAELTTAQAARTDPMLKPMVDWDLALPPDTFALAIATFGALDQITGLAALDVNALLKRLNDAETAYAEALKDQASIGALQQAATDKLTSRQADAARYTANADQRVLAVVRGDL
jgi:hypothetical protein